MRIVAYLFPVIYSGIVNFMVSLALLWPGRLWMVGNHWRMPGLLPPWQSCSYYCLYGVLCVYAHCHSSHYSVDTLVHSWLPQENNEEERRYQIFWSSTKRLQSQSPEPGGYIWSSAHCKHIFMDFVRISSSILRSNWRWKCVNSSCRSWCCFVHFFSYQHSG